MSDIDIRKSGRAGRITLTRPKALNALSYEMCLDIERALDAWRADNEVALVILDAEGDRAFCAGGDIAEMYRTGTQGDYAYGRRFWADEYRMNAKIEAYPKPVVSLMYGFVMGGGVGIGCHGSHRIVGETSRIAMPECGIGLVPDVGGSYLLARAPGFVGTYLGTTGARMDAADALRVGFADFFVPQEAWPGLIAALEEHGDAQVIPAAARATGPGALAEIASEIDAHFDATDLAAILESLQTSESEFAKKAATALRAASPLSVACTIEILRRLRADGPSMAAALDLEYRFTARAMEHGDFLEGIRAAIIDKDRAPHWRHETADVPTDDVRRMLEPLEDGALDLAGRAGTA
ncbi:enoyl-CoA hydratase/isomerase family protein [Sulfitobacter sp. D35]|uniref:enoyl-CoA hydratase/isomerase family protein n=1 Tax=Sulfitobacter sp. D35 TaxID=3083252 RepID=UPI00296F42A2|nr:enoyl-CoA hydratase/isomerase family protein [Sulfitobacter sp. D35]MDW4496780.1 enoyl-CoA hydratase/isomerase family protein [Sulfitobacter sp. D35]